VDQITSPLPLPRLEEVHVLTNKSQLVLNKNEKVYPTTSLLFGDFHNNQSTTPLHHHQTVSPRVVRPTVSLQRVNNVNNNNDNLNINHINNAIKNQSNYQPNLRVAEFKKLRRHFGDRISAIQKENHARPNDVTRPLSNGK